MKQKIIRTTFIASLFASQLFAQIPNADFENWTLFGGWFSNPDEWTTNNSQILITLISPDSDAYNGNLAMHLYNNYTIKPQATTRFAYSNNVTAVNAYIKLKVILNDTVSITVREMYNGVAVDTGNWLGTSDYLNYTAVNIPVSQNNNLVDTVEIEITGGDQMNLIFEGTSFLVDHLTLNPTSINEIPVSDAAILVYPNPSVDAVCLYIKNRKFPEQLKLIDSEGKLVRQFEAVSLNSDGNGLFKFDISTIAAGIYFIQLNEDLAAEYYKFIKQ